MNLLKFKNSFQFYRFYLSRTRISSVLFNKSNIITNYQTVSDFKTTQMNSKPNDLVNLNLNYNQESTNSSRFFKLLLFVPFVLIETFKKANCEIRSLNEKNECNF